MQTRCRQEAIHAAIDWLTVRVSQSIAVTFIDESKPAVSAKAIFLF